MAAEHDDPGEGSGRRPHPTRRRAARHDDASRDECRRAPRSTGKVRAGAPDRPRRARRAVPAVPVATAPRRARSACRSAGRRSACSACSACRSARSARTTCCTSTRRTAASPACSASSARPPRRVDDRGARRDRHGQTPATSASASSSSSCARARKRGAARFHVACADADGNVELFMQAGLRALRRGARPVPRRRTGRCPTPWTDERAAAARIRPAQPLDALPLSRLYASATPAAGPAPRGASGCPTGSARARTGGCPRSSLAPILRFADVEAFVQDVRGGGKDGTQLDGVRPDRRRQGGPAALPQGHRPGRSADVEPLIDFGLGVIAARTQGRRPSPRPRRPRARCEPTNHRSTGGSRRRASARSRPSRC